MFLIQVSVAALTQGCTFQLQIRTFGIAAFPLAHIHLDER